MADAVANKGIGEAAPAGASRRPQGGPQKRRRNRSRYGTQMVEKQNLKKIYGVREEQLKRYFKEARGVKGETGPMLVTLLERRLDNVIYRSGWAATRPQARQMASHKLVQVNGRVVSIPSLRLRAGDVITVKESKRKKALFDNFEMRLQNAAVPSWLQLNRSAYSIQVTALPTMEEAALGVDIRAIVEYYAR